MVVCRAEDGEERSTGSGEQALSRGDPMKSRVNGTGRVKGSKSFVDAGVLQEGFMHDQGGISLLCRGRKQQQLQTGQ